MLEGEEEQEDYQDHSGPSRNRNRRHENSNRIASESDTNGNQIGKNRNYSSSGFKDIFMLEEMGDNDLDLLENRCYFEQTIRHSDDRGKHVDDTVEHDEDTRHPEVAFLDIDLTVVS